MSTPSSTPPLTKLLARSGLVWVPALLPRLMGLSSFPSAATGALPHSANMLVCACLASAMWGLLRRSGQRNWRALTRLGLDTSRPSRPSPSGLVSGRTERPDLAV